MSSLKRKQPSERDERPISTKHIALWLIDDNGRRRRSEQQSLIEATAYSRYLDFEKVYLTAKRNTKEQKKDAVDSFCNDTGLTMEDLLLLHPSDLKRFLMNALQLNFVFVTDTEVSCMTSSDAQGYIVLRKQNDNRYDTMCSCDSDSGTISFTSYFSDLSLYSELETIIDQSSSENDFEDLYDCCVHYFNRIIEEVQDATQIERFSTSLKTCLNTRTYPVEISPELIGLKRLRQDQKRMSYLIRYAAESLLAVEIDHAATEFKNDQLEVDDFPIFNEILTSTRCKYFNTRVRHMLQSMYQYRPDRPRLQGRRDSASSELDMNNSDMFDMIDEKITIVQDYISRTQSLLLRTDEVVEAQNQLQSFEKKEEERIQQKLINADIIKEVSPDEIELLFYFLCDCLDHPSQLTLQLKHDVTAQSLLIANHGFQAISITYDVADMICEKSRYDKRRRLVVKEVQSILRALHKIGNWCKYKSGHDHNNDFDQFSPLLLSPTNTNTSSLLSDSIASSSGISTLPPFSPFTDSNDNDRNDGNDKDIFLDSLFSSLKTALRVAKLTKLTLYKKGKISCDDSESDTNPYGDEAEEAEESDQSDDEDDAVEKSEGFKNLCLIILFFAHYEELFTNEAETQQISEPVLTQWRAIEEAVIRFQPLSEFDNDESSFALQPALKSVLQQEDFSAISPDILLQYILLYSRIWEATNERNESEEMISSALLYEYATISYHTLDLIRHPEQNLTNEELFTNLRKAIVREELSEERSVYSDSEIDSESGNESDTSEYDPTLEPKYKYKKALIISDDSSDEEPEEKTNKRNWEMTNPFSLNPDRTKKVATFTTDTNKLLENIVFGRNMFLYHDTGTGKTLKGLLCAAQSVQLFQKQNRKYKIKKTLNVLFVTKNSAIVSVQKDLNQFSNYLQPLFESNINVYILNHRQLETWRNQENHQYILVLDEIQHWRIVGKVSQRELNEKIGIKRTLELCQNSLQSFLLTATPIEYAISDFTIYWMMLQRINFSMKNFAAILTVYQKMDKLCTKLLLTMSPTLLQIKPSDYLKLESSLMKCLQCQISRNIRVGGEEFATYNDPVIAGVGLVLCPMTTDEKIIYRTALQRDQDASKNGSSFPQYERQSCNQSSKLQEMLKIIRLHISDLALERVTYRNNPKILIYSRYRDHGAKLILEALRNTEFESKVTTLYENETVSQRRQIVDTFSDLNSNISILVATSKSIEGLNVLNLSLLVILEPPDTLRLYDQIIGRIARKSGHNNLAIQDRKAEVKLLIAEYDATTDTINAKDYKRLRNRLGVKSIFSTLCQDISLRFTEEKCAENSLSTCVKNLKI